jgi:hypothetical protein
MSLSKSKGCYSVNYCLQFLKRAVPLGVFAKVNRPSLVCLRLNEANQKCFVVSFPDWKWRDEIYSATYKSSWHKFVIDSNPSISPSLFYLFSFSLALFLSFSCIFLFFFSLSLFYLSSISLPL